MSKHVFAIENLVYEYSILDIKKFIGELDDVNSVDVDFKSKTVIVNGGDAGEIERKLMMNSFQVEKLETDEPIKKRTIFKKKEQKTENQPKPEAVIKENTESNSEKDEEKSTEEKVQNKNEAPEKPVKKGGLFKKILGKK